MCIIAKFLFWDSFRYLILEMIGEAIAYVLCTFNVANGSYWAESLFILLKCNKPC